MAVEITFFQGIAVVVLASVGIVATYYFQVARKLEGEIKDVTIKKAWIVEEDLIKYLLITSALCTRKMYKILSKIVDEKEFSKLLSDLSELFPQIMTMSQEVLMSSLDETKLPKEIVEAVRLGDEERDRLNSLSFFGFALHDLVPETVSNEIDRLIKAIVYGVLFGLLIPTLDFLFSQNLGPYSDLLLAFISGLVIATGYYYVKDGIIGMWSIRKLERKVKKLDKAKNTDEIGQTIEEIME